MHIIARSEVGELSNAVRDFKRFTSRSILASIAESNIKSRKEWMNLVFGYHAKYNKRVGEKQFWTHENHAMELTDNAMIESRLNYVHENPVRGGWVENTEDYFYSSARNYAGLNSLLEIELI